MTLSEIVTVSCGEKSNSGKIVDVSSETEPQELIVNENGFVEKLLGQSGKFLLLGWDLDLTGRRLIDEMFHVAACAVDKDVKFTQYIMPSINLSPAASSSHCVTIANVSRYRILKDMQSRKTLRSRSEYSGLSLFLEWLENLFKENACKKIILMWHDSQKIAPLILLKSLERYDMLERFFRCVAGFLDTRELIKAKCSHLKAFSQKSLMKSCLKYDKKQNKLLRSALYRAQLTANLIQELFNNNVTNLFDYMYTVDEKVKELYEMRELLDRQKSLKPIFLPFLLADQWTKQEANNLRKYLAVNKLDFTILETTWKQNGPEGLTELLSTLLNGKNLNNLVCILDNFFDPNKRIYASKDRIANFGNFKRIVKATVDTIIDKLDYLSLNSGTKVKETKKVLKEVKTGVKKVNMFLEKLSLMFIE